MAIEAKLNPKSEYEQDLEERVKCLFDRTVDIIRDIPHDKYARLVETKTTCIEIADTLLKDPKHNTCVKREELIEFLAFSDKDLFS